MKDAVKEGVKNVQLDSCFQNLRKNKWNNKSTRKIFKTLANIPIFDSEITNKR